MSKLILFFVIVALACSVNAQYGYPNFNPALSMLQQMGWPMPMPSNLNTMNAVNSMTADLIRTGSGPGTSGTVFTATSFMDKNGKVTRDGTVVTNDNGKVTQQKLF